MAETKLHSILNTLTVYELNRLAKFLCSPYFNEDEKLIKCFELLAPAFKQQTPPPNQKAIWKAVYGSKSFSNLKFARLYSDLAKKLDEFLVHDKIRNSESEKLQSVAS